MGKHNIQPGDYSQEAANMARLGYLGTACIALTGIAVQTFMIPFEVVKGEQIGDNITSISALGTLGIAATVGLSLLENHYQKRADSLRRDI